MWIRSQNKQILVDAKRIMIYCSNNEYKIINQYKCSEISDDFDSLGVYKTEKRALEVLQEIQSCIGDVLHGVSRIYEMPEK